MKWNLEADKPIDGPDDARIRWLVAGLRREGRL